jgi:hypothetical protein
MVTTVSIHQLTVFGPDDDWSDHGAEFVDILVQDAHSYLQALPKVVACLVVDVVHYLVTQVDLVIPWRSRRTVMFLGLPLTKNVISKESRVSFGEH